MTPPAASEPPFDNSPSAQPRPAAPVTRVEDTTAADVADGAANQATDELIDQAEADPVVPGGPRGATHRGSATRDPSR